MMLAALVVLPDADQFWRFEGFGFLAGPLPLILVLVEILLSRKRAAFVNRRGLPWSLLVVGFLLTLLFWLRVRIGMPAQALSIVGVWIAVALAAAAPAQVLALLHRNPDEGLIPTGTRQRLSVHAAALLVGVIR